MDKFINEVYYRSPPGQPRGPTQDIHGYELVDLDLKRNVQPLKAAETTTKDEWTPQVKYTGKDKRTFKKPEWPVVVLIVLLSLMLALLVIMLCLIIAVIAVIPAKDDSPGPDLSCNCTELIDSLIYQESFPNFTKWANDVSHKVNTDVRESLPNFTQWSNDVVHNIRETFPNFTHWAHDVVHKVNTNVTKTFPQWADNVVHNVRESFPNFTQQTNDVVHRVNTNVTLSIPKFTEIDSQILQTARTSAQDLASITSTLVTVTSTLTTVTDTLASLQDTSTSTAGVVDDILATTRETLTLLANLFPISCKQIFTQFPSSPSDYYTLASNNGSTYSAYCNMEELCGSGEGWTRLAYLDMSDSTVNCPSGFRLYHSGGVRACGRPATNGGSCASVQFPSNGIRYSQICGRVTGYKYNSPDAVINSNINGAYVDGVSITRGSLRNHVWTLIASRQNNLCPCSIYNSHSVPYFVGSHYFCESSNSGNSNQIEISNPFWDGQGCNYYVSPCCNVPGIPWFHRDYGNTTSTDYIELRVCGDEGTSNEDVPVGYYEIYV
uniref:Uncharacterized protein n=1 Tax=Amphimedon queenslandica TaxID=400682 RepID=A0A1X7TL97_AMPQE